MTQEIREMVLPGPAMGGAPARGYQVAREPVLSDLELTYAELSDALAYLGELGSLLG